MLQTNPIYSRVSGSTMEDSREMNDVEDFRENFTNFSIDEILKPDFGNNRLTTGVLNLSKDRRVEEQIITYKTYQNLPISFNFYGNQFEVLSKSGLENYCNRPEFFKHVNESAKCVNFKDRQINGLSETCQTQSAKNTKPKYSDDSNDSSGDSVKTSPPTSPSGTPGSSPSASPEQCHQNSKLWPAWVYCTRYSDRPSSGKYHFV